MTDRHADHPIDPLFLDRWSPRAFDASDMPEADLLTILEAARWAPSAYNLQPWRFLYATRGSADWERFLALLVPANHAWVRNASVLLYVVSDSLSDANGKTQHSHTHSFDAGAAWANLALQATRSGYQAHGMIGIDLDRVRSELGVPERFRVEAAIALGRQADPSTLPDKLREREVPSGRRPLTETVYPGNFRA